MNLSWTNSTVASAKLSKGLRAFPRSRATGILFSARYPPKILSRSCMLARASQAGRVTGTTVRPSCPPGAQLRNQASDPGLTAVSTLPV
jgi:hypothetical protein